MFENKINIIILALFSVLFSSSLVFSQDPAFWNLSEGGNGVTEYAYDSGSFMLQEGYEFTRIYVSAKVQNGQFNQSMMSAEAHIEVGSWIVHAEVASTTGTQPDWEEENPNGTGSCDEWYWFVDTRNNIGTGSAWCRWCWNTN